MRLLKSLQKGPVEVNQRNDRVLKKNPGVRTMHWVDRGQEPQRLAALRARYTPKWVRYYTQKRGPKPYDMHWLEFREQLGNKFFRVCGYCEQECKAEVDHFRPKSKYPELVYKWDNWVYSCHECNSAKGDKWAGHGYVDPCAKTRSARPEEYFDFDVLTGRIIPKGELNVARHSRAMNTIRDLGLNDFARIKRRLSWIRLLSEVFGGRAGKKVKTPEFITKSSSREEALSSLTRAYFQQKGIEYS